MALATNPTWLIGPTRAAAGPWSAQMRTHSKASHVITAWSQKADGVARAVPAGQAADLDTGGLDPAEGVGGGLPGDPVEQRVGVIEPAEAVQRGVPFGGEPDIAAGEVLGGDQ